MAMANPATVESAQSALEDIRTRIMQAHQKRSPLRLRGAGTKDFYGERLAGEPLDLKEYRGIIDYEPSELVLTARCGTPLSQIEPALAQRGQCLAFEPPAFGGDPTIGGVIAAGLSGPRRPYAGAARDFVLGAVLLAGDGVLRRFGGQVMKNVAGFDVSRLLCGSLGILGVISEVSIKVLPLPGCEVTVRLEISQQDAITAFNCWAGQPLPLSATAWHEGSAWVRLSGAESAVRAARERIGGEHVDSAAAAAWWNGLRHQQHPFFNHAPVFRLSLPSTTPPLKLAGSPLIEWGAALRWYSGDTDPTTVRNVAISAGGTALCWRGPAPAGRFHPLSPAIAAIHRRLKERFDPHGIFNPGRLLPDL
jgi:glycolate oxidase FAD binding subunit